MSKTARKNPGDMSVEELRVAAADAQRRAARLWCRGRRRSRWQSRRYAAQFELECRELASRPPGSPPTPRQRAFLEMLIGGARSSSELAEQMHFEGFELGAAIADAYKRGWIRTWLGGVGGIMARPPSWYELTPRGEAVLEDGQRE